MAFIHGKNTVLTVATKDISQYCTSSELERTVDSHDVTGYGKSDHVVLGGLRAGTFSIDGNYDNTTSTGPRAVLQPTIDAAVPVAIVRKPEGTGVGKPQESFSALCVSYVETSPVADKVSWSAKFTVSDAITSTTQ